MRKNDKQKALNFDFQSETQMLASASDYFDKLSKRRSVRDFSSKHVDRAIIEKCLLTAGSAPSGANRQPWHFCVVSSADVKEEIRRQAEQEEREFYSRRATESWLEDLEPLGTDEHKPFLEIAPYLIVVFAEKWQIDEQGNKHKNYYVPESVGIATGLLISALHTAGLATLTHTPSPMRFLNSILNRPTSETPSMIVVAGYPADGVTVPDIGRKRLQDIASFI